MKNRIKASFSQSSSRLNKVINLFVYFIRKRFIWLPLKGEPSRWSIGCAPMAPGCIASRHGATVQHFASILMYHIRDLLKRGNSFITVGSQLPGTGLPILAWKDAATYD
jgi:hypothetical protein